MSWPTRKTVAADFAELERRAFAVPDLDDTKLMAWIQASRTARLGALYGNVENLREVFGGHSMSEIYRQGDVLIEKVSDEVRHPGNDVQGRPTIRQTIDNNVLAEGEVTGHAHRVVPNIEGDQIVRWEDFRGEQWMTIPAGGAVVQHEEHGTIQLTEGTYKTRRQREYDPAQNRMVLD